MSPQSPPSRPQTLLDLYYTGRQAPDVGIREAFTSPGLTEDEKAAIRSMLESSGWKILANRVWTPAEYQLLHQCARTTTPSRFEQGKYEGFKLHEELAFRAVREDKPKPAVRERTQRKGLRSSRKAGTTGRDVEVVR